MVAGQARFFSLTYDHQSEQLSVLVDGVSVLVTSLNMLVQQGGVAATGNCLAEIRSFSHVIIGEVFIGLSATNTGGAPNLQVTHWSLHEHTSPLSLDLHMEQSSLQAIVVDGEPGWTSTFDVTDTIDGLQPMHHAQS